MSDVVPVVFCFDKRIIPGSAVAISSLLNSAKDTTTYDVRIFHSDLSLENQKKLSSLAENTRHSIAFHYIAPELFKGLPKSRGSWTEIVYYRFCVPALMPEYDKVIYSDVDVLFKGDLSELYHMDTGDSPIGAIRAERNGENMISHKYFPENRSEFIFWSGLLLFNNKKFVEQNTFCKLLDNARFYGNRLKCFDLDLMNLTLPQIAPLPLNYCVVQSTFYFDYREAREYRFLKDVYSEEEIAASISAPVIIHYAGKLGKPWRMKRPYQDYQQYLDRLPAGLKKYTFRDLRKKLFNRR